MERAEFFDEAVEFLLQFDNEPAPNELIPASCVVGFGQELGENHEVRAIAKYSVNNYLEQQRRGELKEILASLDTDIDGNIGKLKDSAVFLRDVFQVLSRLKDSGEMWVFSQRNGWRLSADPQRILLECEKAGISVGLTHIEKAQELARSRPKIA